MYFNLAPCTFGQIFLYSLAPMDIIAHQKKQFDNLNYVGKSVKNREFEQCIFKSCDFSNSDFSGNRFTDCTFIGCNLGLMKLNGTTLNGVKFIDCKLIGINFSKCTDLLFSLSFEKCLLDYASFAGKKMMKTPFIHSSLKNTDFSDTNLTKAVFDQADLQGAVFSKTNLQEANLATAFNFSLDPEANYIKQATFSQQGLSGLLTKHKLRIT